MLKKVLKNISIAKTANKKCKNQENPTFKMQKSTPAREWVQKNTASED